MGLTIFCSAPEMYGIIATVVTPPGALLPWAGPNLVRRAGASEKVKRWRVLFSLSLGFT